LEEDIRSGQSILEGSGWDSSVAFAAEYLSVNELDAVFNVFFGRIIISERPDTWV